MRMLNLVFLYLLLLVECDSVMSRFVDFPVKNNLVLDLPNPNKIHIDPRIDELLSISPNQTLSVLITFKGDFSNEIPVNNIRLVLYRVLGNILPHPESITSRFRTFSSWIVQNVGWMSRFSAFQSVDDLSEYVLQGRRMYGASMDRMEKSMELFMEELKDYSLLEPKKKYILTNSILIEANYTTIARLLRSQYIEEIYVDSTFQKKDIVPPNNLDIIETKKQGIETCEWNIKHVGAERSWSVTKGGGLVYASADTGVDWEHPIVSENYAGWVYSGFPIDKGKVKHDYAWWDGTTNIIHKYRKASSANVTNNIHSINSKKRKGSKKNRRVPYDDNGHGTHTTGIAVGGLGIGMAPESIWIACKNMDMNGVGSPSTYLSCLEFFFCPTDLNGNHPDPSKRPHVINNSYGCSSREGCSERLFAKAIRRLRDAGIVLVASSGNTGPTCDSVSSPPAFEPGVITVGALQYKSNIIAPFSSRSQCRYKDRIGNNIIKPDMVSPGVNIRSAYSDGFYAYLSGTSMASPHVSGAILLLSSACNHLYRKVNEIENVLKETSIPLRAYPGNVTLCNGDVRIRNSLNTVPNNVYGYGLLRVDKAIEHCIRNK